MSERLSFNLIDQPWIPCETLAGEREELGLAAALNRAHELRGVYDTSPMVTAALHRLLLAILHRCFGPGSMREWKDLWRAQRFEEAKVTAYLTGWRQRFDLFDADRPFYQCPGMTFVPKPASQLVAERSNYGSARDLFEHRPPGWSEEISAAEAARWLVAQQSFALGQTITGDRKAGDPTSASTAPLGEGAMVLVAGESLFETLLLNLLVYDPQRDKPLPGYADDAPAWERNESPQAARRVPRGWLDLLTWQSRRMLLFGRRHGGQPVVHGAIVAGGYDIDRSSVQDPMLAWKAHKKSGWRAVAFRRDQVLWRDSTALLRLRSTESLRPMVMDLIDVAVRDGILGRAQLFMVDLLGQVGDQARIIFSRHERMPLPATLLVQQERVAELGAALDEAVTAEGVLRDALRRLGEAVASPGYDLDTKGRGKPLDADVKRIIEGTFATGIYWSRLREHFDSLILGLGATCETESADRGIDPVAAVAAARDTWRRAVVRTARDAYVQASRALGDTAPVLKGAVRGEQTLSRGLAKLAPPTTQGDTA